METKTKKFKNLKIKKIKFLKELKYTVDVQTGGCSYNNGCTHIM